MNDAQYPSTGWQEAGAWLDANAPNWKLAHGESRLVPGLTIGAPTHLKCEVTLYLASDVRQGRDGPWLLGEGGTLLEAVQNAVGGLR